MTAFLPTLRRRPFALLLCALLALLQACATTPPLQAVAWQEHASQVEAMTEWALSGRLAVRQQEQAETVRINWRQSGDNSLINLSSTFLGLGAVRIQAEPGQVVVEKAGETARILPSLDALSSEYIPYDFPAAWLLWWIRGLPVPELATGVQTISELGVLQELEQSPSPDRSYTLRYENYREVSGLLLPGRIRLNSQGVQLTFIIDTWHSGPS
ncbi:MAG TPA: outer membrane lipoprotein LolB [Pseudomonadaceae bacterium]|nr:outer membrane lipoprotein LolB [Pseudomonadaceae bacterium]